MSKPSDALRQVYEQRGALEYAHLPDSSSALDRKFERITEVLGRLLPCEALLDAGCGDGRYLAALRSLGYVPPRVAGIDIADSILATAASATAAAGVPAELVRANLEELPFEDEAFDVILCTQVIEHLLDPIQALQELHRVLQPGGVLLITTDHRGNRVSRFLNGPRTMLVRLLRLRGRRRRVHFPHRDFERDEFSGMLHAAGFSVRRIETFRFHVTDAPAAIQRLLNTVDRRLGPHGVGDILLVVCEA